MIRIDLQCSFAVGATMALVARRRLVRATPAWIAAARGAVLVVATMVFAPLWLFLIWRYTEWETMYRWDHQTIPAWLVAGFLPLIPLAASLGFWLCARLLARARTALAAIVLAVPLASAVAIAALGWQRVTYVGSLVGFAQGQRHNIAGSDFMWELGACTVLLVAPCTVLAIVWLREDHAA